MRDETLSEPILNTYRDKSAITTSVMWVFPEAASRPWSRIAALANSLEEAESLLAVAEATSKRHTAAMQLAPPVMSALVCEALAEDFSSVRLAAMPGPVPRADEALVRIEAASLNFPDLLMLRGAYQFKPEPPFVCGMDFAGIVASGGEMAGLAPGDRVAGGVKTGAFAEYCAAPVAALVRVPDNMDLSAAAAFPAAYTTAYVALVERARLAPGETLLVHGSSGGVGLAAMDVGRLRGARVLAATGSPSKAERLRACGAAHVILTTHAEWRQEVLDLTDGRGADVIFDPVGGDVFDQSVRCIAFDGRLLVVGFAGGRIADLKTNMPLIKGFSVLGVRAGEYGRRFPERGRRVREEIWRWAEEGRVRPTIHTELPLERWREAFEAMRDRGLVGKIVLRPGGASG